MVVIRFLIPLDVWCLSIPISSPVKRQISRITLLQTTISLAARHIWVDDFLVPKVGYCNMLVPLKVIFYKKLSVEQKLLQKPRLSCAVILLLIQVLNMFWIELQGPTEPPKTKNNPSQCPTHPSQLSNHEKFLNLQWHIRWWSLATAWLYRRFFWSTRWRISIVSLSYRGL